MRVKGASRTNTSQFLPRQSKEHQQYSQELQELEDALAELFRYIEFNVGAQDLAWVTTRLTLYT
jgi:hypothetical protein